MFLISQIRIYPQFFHGLCTFTIDVYSIYFRSDVDVPSGWHCSPVQVTLYIVRRAENRFGNSGKIGKVIFQLRDQTRRGNWIVLYTVCCFFFLKWEETGCEGKPEICHFAWKYISSKSFSTSTFQIPLSFHCLSTEDASRSLQLISTYLSHDSNMRASGGGLSNWRNTSRSQCCKSSV